MEFYILSIKWSRVNGLATWWKPGDCGYTMNLDEAGRYSDDVVKMDPQRYDNAESTRAIPCNDADKMTFPSLSLEAVAHLVSKSEATGKRQVA